jgi:hypothetical protein
MVDKIVVGLFEAKGIAEDVRNRLVTDGTPPAEINVRLLRQTAPLPSYMEAESAALEVDPMVWGDVRDSFATFIRNGETAVLVRAVREADVDAIIDTMRQYTPLQITVMPTSTGQRTAT